MTLRRYPGADRRLYLEDLHVGQRFVSRSHAIDKEQMKAFAAEFDPQAFHLDDEAAKTTLFGGLATGRNGSAKRRIGVSATGRNGSAKWRVGGSAAMRGET